MKIRLITHSFYPEANPYSLAITRLCETLAASGVTIEVVTPNRKIDDHIRHQSPILDEIGIKRLGKESPKENHRFRRRVRFAIRLFFYLISSNTPAMPILVCHQDTLACRAITLSQTFRPTKVAVMPQSIRGAKKIKIGLFPILFQRYAISVQKYLFELASYILPPSDDIALQIKQQHPSLSKQKFVTSGGWSDSPAVQLIPDESDLDLPRKPYKTHFTVAINGTLSEKTLDSVYAIAKAVTKEHLNIGFIFLTHTKKQKSRIHGDCIRHHLNNIFFLNDITRQEWPQHLSQIKAAIYFEDHPEQQIAPYDLYLSASALKPIIYIGDTQSNIAKLIKRNRCGTLIDPMQTQLVSDTLMSYYHHRNLLDTLSRGCEQLVENDWSPNQACATLLPVIKALNHKTK